MGLWVECSSISIDMSSKWLAKHFACWSGREQKDHHRRAKTAKATSEFDEMSITRSIIKRGGGGGHQNCAKDGVVKCCDKFCKNHCNLSMIRNDLKGDGRRSLNAKSSKVNELWSLVVTS